MSTIVEQLHKAGRRCLYWRTSALSRYHGQSVWPLQIVTDASLVELARIFPDPEYPALPDVSMRVRWQGGIIDFCCVEDLESMPRSPFPVLNIFYDPERSLFLDPDGVYPALRKMEIGCSGGEDSVEAVMAAAVLVSRFPYSIDAVFQVEGDERRELSPDVLRDLLERILPFEGAWRALSLLKDSGFVARYWPDLARLSEVEHDKDFHPEGDGWKHSLEALKQRKKGGLELSLALLLHDIGKTVAGRNGERAFDGHSELGVGIAARFLRRMGFSLEIEKVVGFLIRHHMLPGALHRMPAARVDAIMGSELYPMLLEVYRADLLATWADDAAYHNAFRHYKKYLKHRRNPFRDARGAVKRR